MMKIFSALSVGMREARNRAAARADERGIDMVWGIAIAVVALAVAVVVVPQLIELGGRANNNLDKTNDAVNQGIPAPTS